MQYLHDPTVGVSALSFRIPSSARVNTDSVWYRPVPTTRCVKPLSSTRAKGAPSCEN